MAARASGVSLKAPAAERSIRALGFNDQRWPAARRPAAFRGEFLALAVGSARGGDWGAYDELLVGASGSAGVSVGMRANGPRFQRHWRTFGVSRLQRQVCRERDCAADDQQFVAHPGLGCLVACGGASL